MDEKTREGAPLGALLSDPKLLSTLTGLLGTSGAGTKESGTSEASAPSPLSEGLAGVLSNPELMAKLPSVIAMLKPMLDGSTPPADTNASEKETSSTPEAADSSHKEGTEDALPAGAFTSPHRNGAQRERCRNDLLLALKPFLSHERCEAVDMILRLSALGAVLKQLH